MDENVTAIYSNMIIATDIVLSLYSLCIIISTFICLMIIWIVYVTPTLYSPTNLLISNTCLCFLISFIVSILNTIFYNLNSISSDWSCRIRGYLTYVVICLIIYSFVIQAISRLFWTVLYKHRYLLSIKCHFYLIFFQILLSFLFPLSSIITTNITFHPSTLCVVPIQYKIHSLYLLSVVYFFPVLIVIILYIIIYRHTTNSSLNAQRILHGRKRDRDLAKNILILLIIYLFGGIPLSIYVILSDQTESLSTGFFLFSIMAPAIAVLLETIMTVILNRKIRNVLKRRWNACYLSHFISPTRVLPFDNTNLRTIRTISKMVVTVPAPNSEQKEHNSS